jgi:hypothetical protein
MHKLLVLTVVANSACEVEGASMEGLLGVEVDAAGAGGRIGLPLATSSSSAVT